MSSFKLYLFGKSFIHHLIINEGINEARDYQNGKTLYLRKGNEKR